MMLKNPLPVAELFRLDNLEELARRPEDEALFYLFRLDDLFPREQRLAIDVSSGVTRVYAAGTEHAIVAETQLNKIETRLFTALVLSHPFDVANDQMRALYKLDKRIAVRGKRARAMQENDDDRRVRDVIAACNLKLKPLALVIAPIDQDTAYHLTPAHREARGINEERRHV